MATDSRRRGPIPPVFFLLALLAAAALHKLAPVKQLINEPWNFAGLLFIAAGVAKGLLSPGAFLRAGTPHPAV